MEATERTWADQVYEQGRVQGLCEAKPLSGCRVRALATLRFVMGCNRREKTYGGSSASPQHLDNGHLLFAHRSRPLNDFPVRMLPITLGSKGYRRSHSTSTLCATDV